ncbi:MAG: hypothetical protein IJ435_03705 [Clostridia bacterium]|nr:hypothetical protein [Clostridia bacterium]
MEGGVMVSAGRPLKYTSKKKLQEAIDDYFEKCKGRNATDVEGEFIRDKYGLPIIVDAFVPTITGLALHLGFKSRQALINYQEREDFADIIREAKMRVEEYAERRLFDRDGVRGAMFTLCNNFGWSEKSSDSSEEEMLKKMDEMIGAIDNAAKRKAE